MTTTFRPSGASLHALAIDPDGRVVAGGDRERLLTQQFAVARYLP